MSSHIRAQNNAPLETAAEAMFRCSFAGTTLPRHPARRRRRKQPYRFVMKFGER